MDWQNPSVSGCTAQVEASVVELLLIRGTNMNLQNNDGDTAMGLASDSGRIAVEKLLRLTK